MTERLSDFCINQIRDVPTLADLDEVSQMARELLDLRAKLAAGPVMPEVPSEAVLLAGIMAADSDDLPPIYEGEMHDILTAVRNALVVEQNDPR